jgi:septal ring factor EnvC (AmiA/AmiB activator)
MSKRDVYLEKLKAKLDKWNSDIHVLEKKISNIRGESKEKYENQLKELHKYRDMVKHKISEVQETGEESWKELKSGLDRSWKSLKKGIKEAEKKLKKE